MKAFSDEPQLTGVETNLTSSGLAVAVTLSQNDDSVSDVWLADLAVGDVCELVRSDQTVASQVIRRATAEGPGRNGDAVTSDLGVGAVRLGQAFGSRDDSVMIAHVTEVAARFGLQAARLKILHPLESAMSVAFVVPTGTPIDWTIDELRTALVGKAPDVEGVLIELDDSNGQRLLESGVAYRTGEGGLWFGPGQAERFGALYGGTPGG